MLPHHNPRGGFRNPVGSPLSPATRGDFLRFLRNRLGSSNDEIVMPSGHLLSDEAAAEGWAETTGNKLQWLGHSAFRWCLGGTVFLSDPLLTASASPLSWAGPKRFARSPLLPEDAAADLLLLTHNHYDHLDLRTLRRLPNKERLQVIAPLGLTPLLRSAGLRHITELDWHESVEIAGVNVTLLPAIHFSARTPFDRNRTLWGGYAMQAGDLKVYLSGDTGYHPSVFREVGEMHGPFDYGLVPIGAYEPRRIMVEHHATPEEGVALGRDVGARTLIGHHWGALRLTTEPPFEPPQRYHAAAAAIGYLESDVWLLKVGETRQLPGGR